MNDKRNVSHPPAGGLALNDIYYVLFRNKWKIIILSTIGLLVAGGIYFYRGTMYTSEADVWIKYVTSNKPQGPPGADGQTIAVDPGAEGIINTEMAFLNSFDLAIQVATNIGPEKVLAMSGGGTDKISAASLIHENMTVEPIPRSPVLRIMFSHRDRDLVQRILQEIIAAYQNKHLKARGAVGASYDMLVEETSNLKKELDQTEEELRKAKSQADISDIDDAKKSNGALILQLHEQVMLAEGELFQREALLKKLKQSTNDLAVAVTTTNSVASTNALPEVPQEKIDDYNQAVDFVDTLRKSYYNLRTIYPEHNALVQEKLTQVKDAEKAKQKMEKDEPRLVKLKAVQDKSSNNPTATVSTADRISDLETMIGGLQDKIKYYQTNMAAIHTDMTKLDTQIPAIRDLERKAQNQEAYYKNYLNSLEQAKIDNDIGASKSANIQVTQEPSPPSRERSKTPKIMGAAAGAGIILGLAWAFLTELYLDHSVRRPKEIETNLGLRLFLSIPDMSRNGHRRLAKAAAKEAARLKDAEPKPLLPAPGEAVAVAENGKLEIAPWDRSHSLHMYHEALRDRLISYFEANDVVHKPKLIAVTGAAGDCGTTTIASGLAASLSETGDGNVLLIDMNLENGATQEFNHGKPRCELDVALVNETMNDAKVQNHLYMVSGQTKGDKISRMLPNRFANLVPKLRASDYDYIIFDMPPVGRTGVTQRLSGFMDMMLLVVEAEKTSRDVARQAGKLLNDSKANVSVVLNKTQTYIPKRLHQEF